MTIAPKSPAVGGRSSVTQRLMRGGVPQVSVFLLLLITAACAEHGPYVPADGVSVERYYLSLEVSAEEAAVDGTVQFDLHHPDTLRQVELLAGNLSIGEVWVNDATANYERNGSVLAVGLPEDTLSSLSIGFSGSPSEGLYLDQYANRSVLYTDSWPYRGQHWWPALHHPSVPSTWTLELSHSVGDIPVATGERTAIDTVGEQVTSTWELGASTPTYSMAFAIGDFRPLDGGMAGDVPITHYVLDDYPDVPFGLQRTPDMLKAGADYVGAYPFSSYSSVQIPFRWAGMENAGKAFLNADRYDDAEALEQIQAHEVFHQWFGNRLPIANWRDLWLSEGITTYLTTLFYELADGEAQAAQKRIEMAQLSRSDLRENRALVPDEVSDPWDHLTWVPYRKGGSAVHLIRLKLDDDQFFEALRTLYDEAAGQPLSTEYVQTRLEAYSGRSFSDIFDVWVYREDLPRLHQTWDLERQRIEWHVDGDRNVLAGVPWEVQICQQDRCEILDGREGFAHLETEEEPSLHPVGVMLQVE